MYLLSVYPTYSSFNVFDKFLYLNLALNPDNFSAPSAVGFLLTLLDIGPLAFLPS